MRESGARPRSGADHRAALCLPRIARPPPPCRSGALAFFALPISFETRALRWSDAISSADRLPLAFARFAPAMRFRIAPWRLPHSSRLCSGRADLPSLVAGLATFFFCICTSSSNQATGPTALRIIAMKSHHPVANSLPGLPGRKKEDTASHAFGMAHQSRLGHEMAKALIVRRGA